MVCRIKESKVRTIRYHVAFIHFLFYHLHLHVHVNAQLKNLGIPSAFLVKVTLKVSWLELKQTMHQNEKLEYATKYIDKTNSTYFKISMLLGNHSTPKCLTRLRSIFVFTLQHLSYQMKKGFHITWSEQIKK